MNNERALLPEVSSDVAIIGLAGRFPGAQNIDMYWQNLCNGVESITFFCDEELLEAGIDPAIVNNPQYVKAAPLLDDVDLFDASFFGYAPREARIIDPQHRLFLECAWEALEHAGYDAETYRGRIGVYGGAAMNTYLLFSGLLPQFVNEYVLTLTGSDKDFLTTRVSYKLNLTGPSVTVQTACSTSLVAVHLACQSLLTWESDMALAGGVSVKVPQKAGHFYREGDIFSPDGHCRAFDARAQGTIFGSGVAIVVLKRLVDALTDGDCIYAVIKGTAINNDGAAKVNYSAPSVERQAEVIVEALANAGVDVNTISYVETHGTGTALGDPIEIAALARAFRAYTQRNGFCAIGSVKTNVGHLDAAAGVAGLIKTALALKHGTIPPSLHYEMPNPEIDFANSPFYVNSTLSEWTTGPRPRRAGISALGVGGTNAHVILEEAPTVEAEGPSRPDQLLLISAKTRSALETATTNLAEYLAQHPQTNLADVAYTLQVGRKSFNHRRMMVCLNCEDALAGLRMLESKRVSTDYCKPVNRNLVFMFPGQGAQYVNMGSGLYKAETTFRRRIDHCSEILQPHLSLDLRDFLYLDEKDDETTSRKLDQTWLTQSALFTVEYALAELWMSWGLRPHALIGHSIGEYVAACLAGVFTLEEALSLVAARGRLMQTLPSGSMLAVPLSQDAVQPFLDSKLSLAAINGPALCVVSGAIEAIDELEKRLSQENLHCLRLRASHAFHSAMMEPILDAFAEQVQHIGLRAPKIPFVSNVTGTWITQDEAIDPGYWVRHARHTVYFAQGIQELLRGAETILLEVGPGQTLSTLVQQHPEKTSNQVVFPSLHHPHDQPSDVTVLLKVLGQLWLAGAQIEWSEFYAHERRLRLPLPTYPFQRQRYWVESLETSAHRGSKLPRETDCGQRIPPPERLPRQCDDQKQSDFEAQIDPDAPALPEPARVDTRSMTSPTTSEAPRTPVEAVVASVWQEVLDLPRVGIYDNFYKLGGHSLLVVQAISRLNQIFQVELPLLSLVESPTIAELSECVEAIYRIESGVTAPVLG